MTRRMLQIAAAAAVMLVLGYLVASQLEPSDLAELWRASDVRLLALALAAYLTANVLRARRFRVLTSDRIPTGLLLRTVLIQNFLNTFLPLRAGEASYLYMVHRTGTIKPGENLASLISARALDLVAALLVPLVTLPMSRAWSADTGAFAWFAVVAGAATTGFVLAVRFAEHLAQWLQTLAAARGPFLQRAFGLGAETLSGLSRLRQSSLLGRVGLLTLGCWLALYLSGYLSLLGVGVSINPWDGLFAYSFPMMASMTPFYMLGGFGVYEGSVAIGLKLVGIPFAYATAAGLLLHVVELVFVSLPAPIALALRKRSILPVPESTQAATGPVE